jgi:hypothetical protein
MKTPLNNVSKGVHGGFQKGDFFTERLSTWASSPDFFQKLDFATFGGCIFCKCLILALFCAIS